MRFPNRRSIFDFHFLETYVVINTCFLPWCYICILRLIELDVRISQTKKVVFLPVPVCFVDAKRQLINTDLLFRRIGVMVERLRAHLG